MPGSAARSMPRPGRSSSRHSCCSTRASSSRSSPSARCAGSVVTRTRRRQRTARSSSVPGGARARRGRRRAARKPGDGPHRQPGHAGARADPDRAGPAASRKRQERTCRRSTSTSRSTRSGRARVTRELQADPVRRGARGRSGRPRPFSRCRPHPWLGHHRRPRRSVRRSSERTIVFSGDLGRPGAPILRDYTAVTKADYVLVETTYGGREHQPEQEALRVLAETVRLVSEANGVLLVPSFAIGRTQELVYQLDRMIDDGPDTAAAALPRLADGLKGDRHLPAPHRVLRHGCGAGPARAGGTPLDYPSQIVTNDVNSRRRSSRHRGRT